MTVTLGAGARLGPYEIISLLGAGGMGEVYRALDTNLKRQVAIKVLPASLATDPERLARFQREAEVLASLNHPNIAHIHGLEKSDGMIAIIMELIEGPTLAERIADGPLAVDDALPIARQIAEALEAAHDKGIVHRDLKPANIKVEADGTVRVLDFGLAKALDPPVRQSRSEVMSNSPTITSPAMMTGIGTILGTAAYMSPEQAKGREVDKRSDIWSFGVMLFEMLTGDRTFQGESVADVLACILKTDPNWLSLPADTPAPLRRLIGRCLEKDVRRRLQSVGEARVQIEDLLTGRSDPITRPTPSFRASFSGRLAIVGVTVLVLGAAVAVASSWLALRATPPKVIRTDMAATGPATLAINGLSRDLAISPDGSRVVYVGDHGTKLFVRALDTREPIVIATGAVREPFVSPDSQWVGFVESTTELKKVAITGGASIHLATLDGSPLGATWLGDGTIILGTVNRSTGLQRISASGGTPTVLTRPDHGAGEADHLWPEVLPGGRVVLFTIITQTGGLDDASIAAFDLRTHESTILVRGGIDAHYVASGHLVYVTGGTLRAAAFDLSRLAVRGSAVPIVPRLVTVNAGAGDFGIASDGTLVYVDATAGIQSARARTLVWVDRTGKEEPIAAAPTRSYEAPRISPDGTQLALAITDQEFDIWVWDQVRGDLKRMTFDPGVDTFPVWTPDSHGILFASNSDGGMSIWSKATDKTDPPTQITTSDENAFPTGISADGKQVVLTQLTKAMGRDLMRLTMDGSPRVTGLLQTPFDELSGTISPDGHWLAYESNSSGRAEIWVRPFPATRATLNQVSTSGGTRPVWSQRGKELFFLGADGSLMRVQVDATETVGSAFPPVKLLEPGYYTGNGNPNRSYDVSSDGQRFLMIKAASPDSATVPPSIIVVQHFDEELKRLVPAK